MKKVIDFLKAHPIIAAVVALLIAFFGTKLLRPSDGSTISTAMARIVLGITSCAFLYLISAEKTFDACAKTTGYVIKKSWELWILPVTAAIMGLFASISSHSGLRSGWPLELIYTVVLCVFIGIFEEVTFRAIVNDALLRKFRNTKGIFVIIAIVSSLIFGAVHVIGADFTDMTVLIPVVLKTVSAGIAGLCYLFMYWKTRNIWACAILHGVYDFFPLVTGVLFDGSSEMFSGGAERYASADSVGPATVVYSLQIVATLAVAIVMWVRIIRKIDFEELRKTW